MFWPSNNVGYLFTIMELHGTFLLNPVKSHLITFGGRIPKATLLLNNDNHGHNHGWSSQ